MGLGHDQPPAIGADPLDKAGDVAVSSWPYCSARVSSPSTSVPRNTWRSASPGKISPTWRCEPVELGEALEVALGADAAGERRDSVT